VQVIVSLVPVALLTILLILGISFESAGVYSNAFIVGIHGAMTAVSMSAGFAIYFLLARLVRVPVVYAIAAPVCLGIGVAGLAIAFVASILSGSLWPFTVGLAALIVLAAVTWPRPAQWTRWTARRA
jgi:hypothetical protein